MKNFITFNGLNKELYLYDTHCHHKDDHIWVIEAVGEYSCWIKQLKSGYLQEYYVDDSPEDRFISIDYVNNGHQ